jgi:hypothetical protein
MFTESFEAAARVGRAASRIELLSYPDQDDRRAELAADGTPRMLLVAPGYPPPKLADDLEDWVRCPIDADELEARLAELERRAAAHRSPAPIVLADGILRVGDRWVTISTSQWAVVNLLAERPGTLVSDEAVLRAYPSRSTTPTPRTAHAMMQRLTKRLAEVGVVVHKVRGRGYLLEVPPKR